MQWGVNVMTFETKHGYLLSQDYVYYLVIIACLDIFMVFQVLYC